MKKQNTWPLWIIEKCFVVWQCTNVRGGVGGQLGVGGGGGEGWLGNTDLGKGKLQVKTNKPQNKNKKVSKKRIPPPPPKQKTNKTASSSISLPFLPQFREKMPEIYANTKIPVLAGEKKLLQFFSI